MATEKKSFILYHDLISMVAKLPDEQAGKLFKIILEYVNGNEPEVDDLLLQIAFDPIRQTLNRDSAQWELIRGKRVMAGKASANKRKQMSTLVECVEQNKQVSTVIVPVIVSDSVTDNVNDTVIVPEKKKRVRQVFIKPTIEEIKEYCEESKIINVDADYFFNHYESNGWKVGSNAMRDWKATVRKWSIKGNNGFVNKTTNRPGHNPAPDIDDKMTGDDFLPEWARKKKTEANNQIPTDNGTDSATN